MVAEIETLGRKAIAIQANAADAAAIVAAVDQTARAFGGLDILVNNAGQIRRGSIESLSLADIDAMLAINVRAVVLASQAASRYLPKGGRIISIASCLAERVPGPTLSLYALTKSALIGFTKGLARDLGPKGITVNVVHPGPTDTDMNPHPVKARLTAAPCSPYRNTVRPRTSPRWWHSWPGRKASQSMERA